MTWLSAVFLRFILLSIIILIFRPVSAVAETGSVLINEVAWMGTAANSADEWVELYNTTAQTVDLTGWGLYEVGGGTLIINLSGSIAAGGYYLIERTDDNSVSDILADIFGPFAGSGLNNSGEHIVLKDSTGAAVDSLDASAGWPAGDNAAKASMERKLDGGWQTNDSVTINGKDTQGGAIVGTPKSANSGSSISSSNLPSQSSGSGSGSNNASTPLLPVLKAEAGGDVAVEVGYPISFSGLTSQGATAYKWYLGDGAVKEGAEIAYTYQFPGTYLVTLEVANGTDTNIDQLRVFVFGGKVLINEFFISNSSTTGGWLEVYNPHPTSADISGWILESGETKFIVPNFVLIPAKGFWVLTQAISGLSLNSQNKIALKYPNGLAVDEAVFEKIQAGYSASRTAEGFFWTKEATPGRVNVVTASGGSLLEQARVVPNKVGLKSESPVTRNYLASFYGKVEPLPQPNENLLPDSIGVSTQVGFWQKLLGELSFWVVLAVVVGLFISVFYIKLHKKCN
ncbi:MAG: lamin tail domain-containing protein [Candidatus Sungbacteria bacterium]|uniref:Lamin tail domain-containing protein n=1 Tax=Candidatus Sungiibacteriota bacterium TaxID=2750080 RepID=A0A931YDF1_9BACT|nr:lamin tail domain-containing protein [Candidatus Sungbacteria bacterium]